MPTSDPKRPYGGLVPSQPKGTRAYQDAASYNQQLAQHQVMTAQAQAASQAANNVFRNPYITQPPPSQQYDASASSGYQQQQQQQQHQQQQQQLQQQQQQQQPQQQPQHHPAYLQPGQSQQPSSTRRLAHQSSHGNLVGSGNPSQQPTQPTHSGAYPAGGQQPNPPSSSYYPASRARASTINNMDNVPPALARLQHMNQDVIGGRNALTPVLNRDDAMKEWERRQQAGAKASVTAYQPLELLQQQVELAAQQGLSGWGAQTHYAARAHPPSALAHQYHPAPPPGAMVAPEDERRDVILSNVRAGARTDNGAPQSFGVAAQGVISSPPQAYTGGSGAPAAGRYATGPVTYQPQTAPPAAPAGQGAGQYERSDINMYVPMQPDQYATYSRTAGATGIGAGGGGAGANPSFYGAAVTGAQTGTPQRNPFTGASGVEAQTQSPNGAQKDRRGSGMDFWPG
jgi:dual specificity protein kinase YAK1